MNISRITPITFIFAAAMLICGCDKSYEDEVITDRGGICPALDPACMVTCDSNGGYFENAYNIGTTTEMIQCNMEYEKILPKREGYILSHWSTEPDGNGIDTTLLNSWYIWRLVNKECRNKTIYAQWVPDGGNFRVILDPFIEQIPNYDKLITDPSADTHINIMNDIPAETAIHLPNESRYAIEGYKLKGWVDPETSVLNKDSYTVKKTATLYAYWDKNTADDKCTLYFRAAEDAAIINPLTGEAVSGDLQLGCGLTELPQAVKEGGRLVGWMLEKDYFNILLPYPGTYEINRQERLSPIWEKEP